MIVWCMLAIKYYCITNVLCESETAVKGKLIEETPFVMLVDFSEYAKQKEYIGEWELPKIVHVELCAKE